MIVTNNTSKKDMINPAAAGVVGAVIGAAGVAAAMVLSNKETRQKVSQKLTQVKDQSMKTYQQLRKKSLGVTHKLKSSGRDAQRLADDLRSANE